MHPEVVFTLRGLARLLLESGKIDEAEAIYREALESSRRLFGNENKTVALTLLGLGDVFVHREHYDEAESVIRETLDILRKSLPEGDLSPICRSCRSSALCPKSPPVIPSNTSNRRFP